MARDKESLIALFIDYDNIAIGLRESGNKPFEVRRVLERLLEKGRIIYKRAYADWYLFSDAKQPLHEHAIEMIDIPMRRNIGKNSADIRLVVDALDLCYTKEHIDTFVIGSGDSDFTPLVSKLKENEKRVIGFGLTQSTSNLLANNCDEFIFYEDLVSLPVNRPSLPTGLSKRQHDAFSLLIDAVAALLRENKDVLWGSLIKDTIRRKRPSFTESQYGYNSFSSLLEDAAKHQLIGLIKDPKSGGTPVVTGFGLAGDAAAAGRPGTLGTQAAPATPKGPSLLVKPDSTRLLPVSNGDGDDSDSKPARSTRSKPGTRRRSTSSRTRKPAAAKAADSTDSKSNGKDAEKEAASKPSSKAGKDADKTDTTAKAKSADTSPASDASDAEKKPARKTTSRRRSTARKPASSKSDDKAAAAEAPKDEPASESDVKDEKPKKPRTRRSPSKAKAASADSKTEPAATEKSADDKAASTGKKTPAKPAPKAAASPEKSSSSKPASAPSTPPAGEEKPKPKGQPLRTRIRRRKR